MELIFLTAAGFGSVLITRWHISYIWTAPRPPFLTLSHQPAAWGCTRNWEGSQSGLMNPLDRYSISHGIVLCHKIQGKEGWRGGCSQLWCLFTRVTIMCDEVWLSWKCLNVCLLIESGESGEWITYLALTALVLQHICLAELIQQCPFSSLSNNCLFILQKINERWNM